MRKDFQDLAKLRADEATVLTNNRKQQGAYYLAGFAIECALKACIAKRTKRHQFPLGRDYVNEVYQHNLEGLLKVANLEKKLEEEMKRNPGFAVNWGVVKDWDVERRYDLTGLKGSDMVTAVTAPDGVLQWIKQHW
jgi:hypothetical protein